MVRISEVTGMGESDQRIVLSHYIGKLEDNPEDRSFSFIEGKHYLLKGQNIQFKEFKGSKQLNIGGKTTIKEVSSDAGHSSNRKH